MGHELEIIDGKAQVMLRENAWHSLGTIVGDSFNWDSAITDGLTVTLPVEKVAISDLIIGYPCQSDEYAAVRADGQVLRTGLGEQWQPFQARQGYEFGCAVAEVSEGSAVLQSLGTLRHGRQWFMSFNAGEFSIGDYVVNDLLTIVGSFDSSLRFQAITSPTLVVCANTLSWALAGGANHFASKNTSGLQSRCDTALAAWQKHTSTRDDFKAWATELQAVEVSRVDEHRILREAFPTDDDLSAKARNANEAAIDRIYEYLNGLGGVVLDRGTGFGLVQAASTYELWDSPLRVAAGQDRGAARATRQIEGLFKSDGQPVTRRVAELVLAS